MQVHEITDFAHLSALQQEWDGLFHESCTQSVYQSFEWVSTWWRHYARGQLWVLVAKSQRQMRCIAPLMLTRQRVVGIPYCRLRFMGSDATDTTKRNLYDRLFSIDRRYGWSDVLDFLYRPGDIEALRAVLGHVQQKRGRWDILDLRDFPASTHSIAFVEEMLGPRLAVVRETPAQAAVVSLEGDMETYKKTRTKNWRKNIKRAYNQMEGLTDVAVRSYRSPTQVAAMMPVVRELEARSWQGQSGVGAFSHERAAAFHHDVAVALAARDRFVLYTLEVADRLIAYQYALRDNDRLHFHTTAMDPAFKSYSPGLYLQLKVIEQAFAEGLNAVVLGRGPETYKHKLKTGDEDRVWVTVFGTAPIPKLLASCEFGARPALRRLWRGARTAAEVCRG
jgi:CelD/BcsL family acetyltransferase involved in cellulose biosynthesis